MTTAFPQSRIASLVCGVVGLVVVNTLPVLLGVLKTHLGLAAAQLGSYGSAETIGLALGTFAAVFALRRLSPRVVAAVGLGLACGADLVSFWLPSIAELTAKSNHCHNRGQRIAFPPPSTAGRRSRYSCSERELHRLRQCAPRHG